MLLLFSISEIIELQKYDAEIDNYFKKNLSKAMKEYSKENKILRNALKSSLNNKKQRRAEQK